MLSVVIPIESDVFDPGHFCERLIGLFEGHGEAFEIILVADGVGEPGQWAASRRDARLRILRLDGRFGRAPALTAGFRAARGDIVVTLPSDGRGNPADAVRLLAPFRDERVAAVCGRRKPSGRRSLSSRAIDVLVARLSGGPVRDTGCGLQAYRRCALPDVQLPTGMDRLLPAALGIAPEAVVEVAVDFHDEPPSSRSGRARVALLRALPSLPFLAREPRRAEIHFALATAAAAACGAAIMESSRTVMVAFDLLAILLAVLWRSLRRFNRAQDDGVYRLREDAEAN
jgi:hypothetical protein